MEIVEPNAIDFSQIIKANDTIIWGQVCAEPIHLTKRLIAQRHQLKGKVNIFTGLRMATTLMPEHCDVFNITAINAGGTNRVLAKAGFLDLLPSHVSEVPFLIESGYLSCDVVLVQLSPEDENGQYSLGVTSDYIYTAIKKARFVIAEINDQVPRTCSDKKVNADEIDLAIRVSSPLPQIPSAKPNDIDKLIAQNALAYIPERATLQLGVGGTPEALMLALRDFKDLGVHSGLLTDSFIDLVECGSINNLYKSIDSGVSVSGALLGTEKLYRFCDKNTAVRMASLQYTHNPNVLAKVNQLVSINSALEVDLTGQVNAESINNRVLGGIGGQVDFIRGASLSQGGRSMIVIPSMNADKTKSRIVNHLHGPVTTPRSDVDLVVTEYGVARLKGLSIKNRVREMLKIVSPNFRESLERSAYDTFK